MSKIFENKQLIHIATEVVILVALVYYFNQKNRKLLNIVEDLAQRVEEQEDLIQKHEEIIKKMVDTLNKLSTYSPQSQFTPQPQPPRKQKPQSPPQEVQQRITKKSVRHTEPPLPTPVKQTRTPVQVSFSKPAPQYIEESYGDYKEEEENSDLDAELAEELSELDTDDLKKHQ